jgi:hypothetical protein
MSRIVELLQGECDYVSGGGGTLVLGGGRAEEEPAPEPTDDRGGYAGPGT